MANKWIQLMSADGTDNLFPTISNRDLLWTNSATGNTFAAQTISLDLSAYKMIEVDFSYYVESTPTYLLTNRAFIDGIKYMALGVATGQSTYRGFTATSTGVAFTDANRNTGSSSSVNNSCMIPYKIYGIK